MGNKKHKYKYTEADLRRLMSKYNGNITHAAEAIGTARRSLSRTLERYKIDKNDYVDQLPTSILPPIVNEEITKAHKERDEWKRKYETAVAKRKTPKISKPKGGGMGGKVVDKLLICPDTHSQFCDMSALQIMLDFRDDWKPTKTIHLGDLVDCEAISSFPKDDAMPLDKEFDIARHHLDLIRPTHYLMGNHEERIQRPALVNKSIRNLLSIERNLDLEARGIEWKPYGATEWFEFGKMKFMHGNYHGEHAGKQHASAYGCVCFGHTHRISQYTVKGIDERATGFNIGTMTKTHMDYCKTMTGWTQGFAFMYLYKSGDFSFYQVRLIGDEFVINDKHYERKAD